MLNISRNPAISYCVILHYSEIGLKSGNRKSFEMQLVENIKTVLSDLFPAQVKRMFGRFILYLPKEFDWALISRRLSKVVGLANFALAEMLEQAEASIAESACRQMGELQFQSFRVATRRVQKSFPIKSAELNARIGRLIQEQSGARVDLNHAETTCFIEIFDDVAVVYCKREPGLRGLPVGSGEKAVSLLSSGIDSPVASYKIITRGVRLVFVHFHSTPFTSPASINNTRRLVERLTEYQLRSKFYSVPFLEIQQAITQVARPEYRVVLYRRSMLRIAERIGWREKARALVTGESIGQVASQTLSNMQAISAVTSFPILRPLSGDDKEQIIAVARKIDTFDISTEPYEDCCSLFVPEHPVTRADMEIVESAESQIDLEALERKAIREAEVSKFRFPTKKNS